MQTSYSQMIVTGIPVTDYIPPMITAQIVSIRGYFISIFFASITDGYLSSCFVGWLYTNFYKNPLPYPPTNV